MKEILEFRCKERMPMYSGKCKTFAFEKKKKDIQQQKELKEKDDAEAEVVVAVSTVIFDPFNNTVFSSEGDGALQ